jgi:hypothetical protein
MIDYKLFYVFVDGRNEIALTLADDHVTLTGAIRSGKEFSDIDTMPVIALKKNIKSIYSCQYERGRSSVEMSLSL